MVYDAVRARVLLLGADTWEWDGEVWRKRVSSAQPPGIGMAAYDAAHDKVVGLTNDQTWTWDGNVWTQETAGSPTSTGGAMTYDAARGNVVKFGGVHDGTMASSETWLWDGSAWTRAQPATSPPPRIDHALAYDAKRHKVVLFGGSTDPLMGQPLADTWEWDGSTWAQLAPTTSPPARWRHVMVYDATRERVLVIGGGVLNTLYNDTWEWDGASWTKLDPAAQPQARTDLAAAYDAARETVVVFGGWGGAIGIGLSDTWLLRYQSTRPEESCAAGVDVDGDGRAGCADPNCGGLCDPLCSDLDLCTGDRPRCGDGVCSGMESCHLCPADCGACEQCGDDHCDSGESCSTCPGDCGVCP
jgi:hypothetical protein